MAGPSRSIRSPSSIVKRGVGDSCGWILHNQLLQIHNKSKLEVKIQSKKYRKVEKILDFDLEKHSTAYSRNLQTKRDHLRTLHNQELYS